MFSLVLKIKRSKNDHRKIDRADLNSPPKELSNGGLGIVVTLVVGNFFVGSYWRSNPAVYTIKLTTRKMVSST